MTSTVEVARGDDAEFRALMEKITRERGFQCASYKDKCLRRRIAVRMRATRALRYEEYADVLDEDPREYEKLMRALTINVTKFFRNWETYEAIEQRALPELFDRGERALRIWSAGCATGEEPYSAAILLHNHAVQRSLRSRLDAVSILATDIDAHCLGEAERAFYGEASLGETPATLRERYFPEVAGLWTVAPEVKKMVTFAQADLLQATQPPEEFHLIMCRNVVIYFERDAQDKLFHQLHRALAPGGFLVLGKVETLLGDVRSLFTPVNARERIFRKA